VILSSFILSIQFTSCIVIFRSKFALLKNAYIRLPLNLYGLILVRATLVTISYLMNFCLQPTSDGERSSALSVTQVNQPSKQPITGSSNRKTEKHETKPVAAVKAATHPKSTTRPKPGTVSKPGAKEKREAISKPEVRLKPLTSAKPAGMPMKPGKPGKS